MRYGPKVSTLEERHDLKKVTMDELHGILTAYEMRTRQNGSSRKEATFKASLKNQSKTQMMRMLFSLINLREGLENTKGSYR